MSNARIQEALNNAEANIAFLATLPDKKLAEKLDTIHLQSEIAMQKKQTASLELLEIWRAQVIEARIYKAENNIPDAANKIELAVADIETFTAKSEERKDILNEVIQPEQLSRSRKVIQPDNDSQLELF
jgi:hypothetical protein